MGKHNGKDVPKVEKLIKRNERCLAICAGKHCAKAGTKQVFRAVEATLAEHGLADTHGAILTKCQDYCDDGPVMTVVADGCTYIGLSAGVARDVVIAHIRDGQPVLERLPRRIRRRLERRRERAYIQESSAIPGEER
jgi:(2Fe-2S) ferredoxin